MATPDPTVLITLAEAKTALGSTTGDHLTPSQLQTLQLMVNAVAPVFEDQVGPVSSAQASSTVVVGSCRSVLILPWAFRPGTITATYGGSTVDAVTYTEEPTVGLLRHAAGFWTAGTYDVSAETGMVEVVPNLKFAAAEIVRHWWQIGQQGGVGFGGSDQGEWHVPIGYALPNRVVQLIAPSRASRMPGFA